MVPYREAIARHDSLRLQLVGIEAQLQQHTDSITALGQAPEGMSEQTANWLRRILNRRTIQAQQLKVFEIALQRYQELQRRQKIATLSRQVRDLARNQGEYRNKLQNLTQQLDAECRSRINALNNLEKTTRFLLRSWWILLQHDGVPSTVQEVLREQLEFVTQRVRDLPSWGAEP
ncbi:MAG: hypothetical protein AAGF24_00155 [Cyanobacteria bacterium P01_H01_bin.121]